MKVRWYKRKLSATAHYPAGVYLQHTLDCKHWPVPPKGPLPCTCGLLEYLEARKCHE